MRAVPRLVALASDTSAAPIWRATAIEQVSGAGQRDILTLASQFLYDDNPMIRTSMVRSLESLPLNQRYQLLQPLIDDAIASVRLAVALQLAGVPLDQIPPEQAQALVVLFDEYRAVHREHADMPSIQMQMGLFYTRRGDGPAAEAAYREAIYLNSQMIPAYLNLADLLRSAQREDEARELLRKALIIAPDSGSALHSMGLLETRTGNTDVALDYLGRAAALEQVGTRHRFVYAIAQHDLGKPEAAIETLQALLRTVPQDTDVLLALANYSAELGRISSARGYAKTLTALAPNNPNFKALLEQLSEQ
jgi:tetratricopeptide (TPR) repeat protein